MAHVEVARPSAPRKSFWQRLWSLFDPNEKYLRTIAPLVKQINALEPEFETLSQQDLQDRLRKIRSRVERAREDTVAAHALLPEPTDSDTRRQREKEIVAAEKAVLDAHLPEVFAAVREGAKRTLSMRHFDVQMLGGIVLHEGRISEMKTGEGKTLTATLPLVLNALAGRGAHLVTVNDYLARRDAEWMGKIYRYLGLSVGVIQHDLTREQRQHAYGCDITYITNHEIGFDYLRDHSSAWRPEHLVIRELYYAIIDEVDSILIDEARVPLIISASRGKPVEKYRKVQEVVARLVVGTENEETKETTGDLIVDEKAKNASLTEDGQRKVEIGLGIDNLNDSAHIEDMHLVNAALKANFCYKRDVDYIIDRIEGGVIGVVIVDTFTGRPQQGRRWSDGLHQAIEAKERVQIQDEQQTIATVTYQNFFLMYQKLAGMTGTAKTEEAEFVGIYDMSVVVVPTNRPMIRLEHADMVFKNEEWKLRGICAEIVQYYCRRQPVLVGTRSVETSERISARLRPDKLRLALQFTLFQWYLIEHERALGKERCRLLRLASLPPIEEWKPRQMADFLKEVNIDPELEKPENFAKLQEVLELADYADALRDVLAHGVPHEVLNARHHEREAQIVAQAGRLGAVTIATNMAGRGTDIVLGGNPEPDIEALLARRGADPKSLPATLFINAALKGDPAAAEHQADEQGGLPRGVLAEIASIRAAWQAEHEDVVAVGGLHILGTERLESRRIDNQLRGRSGRQGDPGSARFYVSLQDELMRLFGPERWGMLMNQWPEEQPVEHKIITKSMDNAQRKVEGRNYDMRKNTLRYDDVMNVQRLHIYAERRRILEGVDLRNTVARMMAELVERVVTDQILPDTEPDDDKLARVWQQLNQRFPLKDQIAFEDLQEASREMVIERLRMAAQRAYDDKENDFIRGIVEFELAASIHETLDQVSDRAAVVAVLTALWPLEDYLPARLAGVADSRLRDALITIAREALEERPREFILAVIADRVTRAAQLAAEQLREGADQELVLAALRSDWPLDLARELGDTTDPQALAEALPGAAAAALARAGWGFVQEALRRQMDHSVDLAVPATCDLDTLLGYLDGYWPLGAGLNPRTLEGFNYGVIEDRLRRLASDAAAAGGDFVGEAARHRFLRVAEAVRGETGDDPAALADALRARYPGVALTPELFAGELDTALPAAAQALVQELSEALVLEALEEVVAQAAEDAHRRLAAGEGEDDEESLEFGDLQGLIDGLNQDWALGACLNPWELERLDPADVRREIAAQVRAAVRTKGVDFIADTADLRLQRLVERAIADHYSLAALCGRLNQHFELPGSFEPAAYAEARSATELVAALTATAGEVLVDDYDPEPYNEFLRSVRGWVDEGWNLRRLCERLTADFRPQPKLEPKAFAETAEDDLPAALLERLPGAQAAVEQQLMVDAVQQHVQLTVTEALHRSYDVRSLSAQVAALWPVRPDAVRASKLKGWNFGELGKRLKETLHTAYRGEEWRFIRRFVLRQMEIGLYEAAEQWTPAGARRGEWDLDALCADLAQRWPLEAAPDPRNLRGLGQQQLIDDLMGRARRLYAERERAFIRATAKHRFGRQLEAVRGEHYSLGRAAHALDEAWGLSAAFGPDELARLRGQATEAVGAAVAALDPAALTQAERALSQHALDRRVTDSVDDVLRRWYNTGRLVTAILGKWPLAQGGLSSGALRQMPYREMVERVRHLLENADGALRRRLVFHNLREAAREIDTSAALPAGQPELWRPGALAAELGRRLPLAGGLEPSAFSAGLLTRALRADIAGAAASVTAAQREAVRRAVAHRVTVDLLEMMRVERRPQTLYERLGQRWPVAPADPDAWRGKNAADLREELLGVVLALFDQGPADFLAHARQHWIARGVDEEIAAYWPESGEPGPWVLAQICEALNQRWRLPQLLHPSNYKQFERDDLRVALVQVAAHASQDHLGATMITELAAAALDAQVAEAVSGCLTAEGWDLGGLAAALARLWPGAGVPTVESLRARLTDEVALRHLLAAAESLEPRVVADYTTEAVQHWLQRRLEAALEAHCSLRQVCAELAARWPAAEVDAGRLGAGAYQAVREALVTYYLEASRAGGERFVEQTARLRLESDLQAGDAEALARRWGLTSPLTLDAALAAIDVPRAFRHETLRRWVRQSVEEAQAEHCNPEIANDRWDHAAFLVAIERQWPVGGRLTLAELTTLGADQLRERVRQVIGDALEGDPAGFIAATTRLRLAHSVHDALDAHASLERLAAVLNTHWPRETRTSAEMMAAGRLEELAPSVAQALGDTGEDVVAAALAGALPAGRGGPDELAPALERLRQRWPELDLGAAWQLDERLVSEHLATRLWREFAEDPRAFVKAVALEDVPRQLERRLMLEGIDTNWCDHLEAMDYLREGINLRGYAQTDPFIAYRKEGRTMFENMLGRVGEMVCGGLFETTDQELVEMHSHGRLGLQISVAFQNVQEQAAKAEELTAAQTRTPVTRGSAAAGGEGAPGGKQTVVVGAQVGRNDKCPCGSGKKYKFCCGRG